MFDAVRARRLARLTLCLLFACVGGSRDERELHVFAQTETPQTVFKGHIDLVRIDVAVMDNRTGKAIRGLTPSDFTVTENGVRQTIATFTADSTTPVAGGLASANQRVFLIMFGSARLDGPVDVFDGVVHFLRECLRPQDLVAVMALNRATVFTTNHEQIATIVQRMKRQLAIVKAAVAEEAARSAFQNRDISPETQKAIDALFLTPEGGDESLRNVTTMLLGSRALRQNRGWRAWNREVAWRDVLKTYAGIDYLRGQAGEKHLICLTRSGLDPPPIRLQGEPIGLRLDRGEGDRPMTARANDAEVALDIIHTAGTSSSPYLSDVAMTSRSLSNQTGGQFTSLRTAEAQLARIDDATINGYILGYVPKDSALDGRYRRVAVTVNRPDVTLLYRRGYTARAEAPPIDLREIVTRHRLREAAATDLPQADIRIRAEASAVAGEASQLKIKVELRIDPSRLTLPAVGEKREGLVDLMILCGDSKQHVIGLLSQQMTLSMDEAHYRRALSEGIPYVATVSITGTADSVKVLVYDFPSDRLGSANVSVK